MRKTGPSVERLKNTHTKIRSKKGPRAIGLRLSDERDTLLKILSTRAMSGIYKADSERISQKKSLGKVACANLRASYYSVVDKSVIPDDTYPIEMLIGNPRLTKSEVTAYILSIDDRYALREGPFTVLLIEPSFVDWS